MILLYLVAPLAWLFLFFLNELACGLWLADMVWLAGGAWLNGNAE